MAVSNVASGFAELDAMIRSLRKLPADFRAAAPALAEQVKLASDRAIDAGESLDGVKWEPKKDGGRALVHSSKSVRAFVSGDIIYLELTGVEVIHHYGTARVPARPFWPMRDGMPPKLGPVFKKEAVKVFDQAVHRA